MFLIDTKFDDLLTKTMVSKVTMKSFCNIIHDGMKVKYTDIIYNDNNSNRKY